MGCFRCCTSFVTVPRQPPVRGLLVLLDRALIPALADIVMAHGWSGIAHVRLFNFQGTKKSNDTLLPWSVVSLLFVICFVVILVFVLWRTRCALIHLSTSILYHDRTFVSMEKHEILCLFLIVFFNNRNMLCFVFMRDRRCAVPPIHPLNKDHRRSDEGILNFTELLTFSDSFSDKVAYKKIIEKDRRNGVRRYQKVSY